MLYDILCGKTKRNYCVNSIRGKVQITAAKENGFKVAVRDVEYKYLLQFDAGQLQWKYVMLWNTF